MPLPDASEVHVQPEPLSSRSRSVSSSTTKSNSDEENREFNKRLLVSLGMLLPALAAIIGVVAWAISAEVVMGAKREAARRHSEPMRLAQKFDYPRFHNVLPPKEMLIDSKSNEHSRTPDSHDFLPRMEEFGQDLMMRKMDEHKEDNVEYNEREKAKTVARPSAASSLLNEKLRDKLTQESIAQLIEKLLNSQTRTAKSGPLVLVTPVASQSRNVSRSLIETRVTTTKPKAFNLKMAPSREEKKSSKSEKTTTSKKKSTPVASSVKRKPSNSANSKAQKPTTRRPETTTTKSPPASKSKNNYKVKIYEKEIDMLLHKIEKLEKQQNIKIEKGAIPANVANSDLLKGRPSEIANKIKGFLSGSHPTEATSKDSGRDSESPAEDNNEWQPSGHGPLPPMPPPMPPMPFMPFMPPSYALPPPPPPTNQEPLMNQDPQYSPQYPLQADYYPKDHMQMESSYHNYQQVLPQAPSQQHTYEQPSESVQSQRYHQPNDMPEQNAHANYIPNNQMSSMSGQNGPSQFLDQPHTQPYDAPMEESQAVPNKKKKNGFLRKFKLSHIFNTVMPKSKKSKQLDHGPSSDPRIRIPNGSVDPMMMQESQMYPTHGDTTRQMYLGEQPGFSNYMGAGPMGGGNQMSLNPKSIIQSLIPGMPKWINGKLIFGVVLENGIGKKPKQIIQHFSTGHIGR